MVINLEIFTNILISFSIGFLGSVHCVGMCGGLANILAIITLKTNKSNINLIICSFYQNIGRVSSYLFISLFLISIEYFMELAKVFRIISGILFIMLGMNLLNKWSLILKIEKIASFVWKVLIDKIKIPKSGVSKKNSYFIGLIWGFLPCSLVYTTSIWAASKNNIKITIILMISFGLGTIPSMITSGFFMSKICYFLKKTYTRNISGVLIIILGIWTLMAAVYTKNHSCH